MRCGVFPQISLLIAKMSYENSAVVTNLYGMFSFVSCLGRPMRAGRQGKNLVKQINKLAVAGLELVFS